MITSESPELLQPSAQVENKRNLMSGSLRTIRAPLAVIIGPCAPDSEHIDELMEESASVHALGVTVNRLAIVHSLPVRKPRSQPVGTWKGMETTDPDGAMELITRTSNLYSHPAMEIVVEENIDDYAVRLALAWFGARNEHNFEIKQRTASEYQNLPLAVKCGLSGEIDLTLEQIERLKAERDANSAPIVLLYRGGENAKDPETWEEKYIDAYRQTEGLLIVDVAHGSEMAHDPNLRFQKSVEGQIAAIDHVIELSQDSFYPAGIKIEASNVPSPIDPVIPLEICAEALMKLRSISVS